MGQSGVLPSLHREAIVFKKNSNLGYTLLDHITKLRIFFLMLLGGIESKLDKLRQHSKGLEAKGRERLLRTTHPTGGAHVVR